MRPYFSAAALLLTVVAQAQIMKTAWTVTAHTGAVNAIAFSPDGRLIATGGEDGLVRLWRTADGAMVATMSPHGGAVNTVTFSSDGTMLLSGGEDRAVINHDVTTGSTLYQTGDGGLVKSLAFRPDGTSFFAGLGDSVNEVVEFQTSDGSPTAVLNDHFGTVWSVDCSQDGTSIASCSADGRALVYKSDLSFRFETGGHDGDVVGVKFSPDSSLVASLGGFDAILQLNRVADGARLVTCNYGNHFMHGLGFSADSRLLAVSGANWQGNGLLKVFRASDGSQVYQFTSGLGSNVPCVAFSPIASILAAGTSDGRLLMIRIPQSQG